MQSPDNRILYSEISLPALGNCGILLGICTWVPLGYGSSIGPLVRAVLLWRCLLLLYLAVACRMSWVTLGVA